MKLLFLCVFAARQAADIRRHLDTPIELRSPPRRRTACALRSAERSHGRAFFLLYGEETILCRARNMARNLDRYARAGTVETIVAAG